MHVGAAPHGEDSHSRHCALLILLLWSRFVRLMLGHVDDEGRWNTGRHASVGVP